MGSEMCIRDSVTTVYTRAVEAVQLYCWGTARALKKLEEIIEWSGRDPQYVALRSLWIGGASILVAGGEVSEPRAAIHSG